MKPSANNKGTSKIIRTIPQSRKHENILIPVGTAIIHVAAVKYALVSIFKSHSIHMMRPNNKS